MGTAQRPPARPALLCARRRRSHRRGRGGHLGQALLRESYSAPTLRQAHWRLVRFYAYAAEVEVPELTRLATTISRWEQEVLSFHTTRISTGPVEAQNLVTEKIRRIYRSRHAQLRQLPPAAVAPLRREMGHSSNCSNPRVPPTPRRVEPLLVGEKRTLDPRLPGSDTRSDEDPHRGSCRSLGGSPGGLGCVARRCRVSQPRHRSRRLQPDYAIRRARIDAACDRAPSRTLLGRRGGREVVVPLSHDDIPDCRPLLCCSVTRAVLLPHQPSPPRRCRDHRTEPSGGNCHLPVPRDHPVASNMGPPRAHRSRRS